jgi:hypothetical protein
MENPCQQIKTLYINYLQNPPYKHVYENETEVCGNDTKRVKI